jgi:replicative superfamily II helicase
VDPEAICTEIHACESKKKNIHAAEESNDDLLIQLPTARGKVAHL